MEEHRRRGCGDGGRWLGGVAWNGGCVDAWMEFGTVGIDLLEFFEPISTV